MFDDLDSTLTNLLNDTGAPTQLRNADVSFQTPDKDFEPAQPTVNLFLFDVKENRSRREQVPHVDRVGGLFVRRMPPLRIDCTYLVTTWDNDVGAIKIAVEHRLLAQAFQWLSRFGTIPDAFLQGNLAGQPFPPLALIAHMDSRPNIGEFWSALSIPPRPSFTVIATITMPFPFEVPEGPPVVTKEIRLEIKDVPGTQETVFDIGGTVTDAATSAPIADASVTLIELDRTVQTNADGRFRISGLDGGPFTLRIAASGFVTLDRAITIPGTTLDAYDASLTT
jgi:hypothetical protein